MKEEKKTKHTAIIWAMTVLVFILIARLAVLTLFQYDKWSNYAEDMSTRVVYETGPRGDITDRNGKIIAGSRAVYSINISKVNIDEKKAMLSASDIIDYLEEQGEPVKVTRKEVSDILADTSYMSYMPLTIAEDVSEEAAEAVQEAGYPGIYISKNYIREYPNGKLASHVVGYIGRISEDEAEKYIEKDGYRKDAIIGKTGIECKYEEKLRGTDSIIKLQVDSLGNVTKQIGKSKTKKGDEVRLTIDIRIQKAAEESLELAIKQAACGGTFESKYGDYKMIYADKAATGAAVAVDVKTGEILALANYPAYDPNDFVGGISAEVWESLQRENPNDPLSPSPLYNIAAMSAVQPGSTFKPVTALAALSCGLDKNKFFYDAGYVDVADRTFGCHLWNDNKETHGYVDLKEAMKVSCNYYFFDIATGMDLASNTSLDYQKKMDNEKILQFAQKVGLGEKTGVEIDESSGTLPSEEFKAQIIRSSLKQYMLDECEIYFKKSHMKDWRLFEKNIEKIINQMDKDLTLDEIIGKLKKEEFIKKDKVDELAGICKYMYYDRMGWSYGDTLNISIGQGDNAYTPLQMAGYMAVLGNQGKKNDLSLILDEDADKSDQAVEMDINKDDIETILDAMTGVAAEQDGSLYGCFGSFPYTAAVKTGTAQHTGRINTVNEEEYLKRHLHLIAPDVDWSSVQSESARLRKEYPEHYKSDASALRRAVVNLSDKDITSESIDRFKEEYDNFAWTVALAPADDPQIAVAVLLVQGKASSNAAPVAREIIGKYGEISQWEKSF